MTIALESRPARNRPVRVSDEAHEILSRLSKRDHSSIPDLIERLARQAEWEEICRQEREAFVKDLENPEAMADYDLWDSTDDDID
ncbi:MAG: hypothetical protein LBM23_03815 [Propionibacteriaceae bacterium]|jgi:hypothetical protein|nr:hypothetical protein [Propionibacteriaceae bacterium]